MPKGYVIGQIDVTDPEQYPAYASQTPGTLEKFGGRFLVRGGQSECKEGSWLPRTVVIEFPSLAAAKACYDDPEYQAAFAIREPAAHGRLIIVEGYEG